MGRHTVGFKSVASKHQFKLVGFIHAAFKAQPYEPTRLALRGLAAMLQEYRDNDNQPMPLSGQANLKDFTVRRQHRVVRSTFGAELHGLVDRIEQMILLQTTLHHIYIYIYIYSYIYIYTHIYICIGMQEYRYHSTGHNQCHVQFLSHC